MSTDPNTNNTNYPVLEYTLGCFGCFIMLPLFLGVHAAIIAGGAALMHYIYPAVSLAGWFAILYPASFVAAIVASALASRKK